VLSLYRCNFLVASLGNMPRSKATVCSCSNGNAQINGQPRHLGVLSCERGFTKISACGPLIIRIGACQSGYHLGASKMMALFVLLRAAGASFVMRRSSYRICVARGLKGQSAIVRKPGMWFAGKITQAPYLLATHVRLPLAFRGVLICHLATKIIWQWW
jgi:hypothetical protein